MEKLNFRCAIKTRSIPCPNAIGNYLAKCLQLTVIPSNVLSLRFSQPEPLFVLHVTYIKRFSTVVYFTEKTHHYNNMLFTTEYEKTITALKYKYWYEYKVLLYYL